MLVPMNKLPVAKRAQILSLLCEGTSMRAVSRLADVSINTDNGVVVLSGVVRSHEQTGVASAHAQRQDGVLRVENNLRPEFS